MAAKKKWNAPRGKDGALLEFAVPESRVYFAGKWVDPDVEWDLDLCFDTMGRGRSAITLYGHDSKGRRWPMKMSKFMEMMTKVTLIRGAVDGRFGVAKQGRNYSIEYRGDVR